jgi:hypothetical protein
VDFTGAAFGGRQRAVRRSGSTQLKLHGGEVDRSSRSRVAALAVTRPGGVHQRGPVLRDQEAGVASKQR